MFLMRADALRGEVGPSEIARADRRVQFWAHFPTLRAGPYKSLVHRWFYEHENCIAGSVADPWHFDVDPDPYLDLRIHASS